MEKSKQIAVHGEIIFNRVIIRFVYILIITLYIILINNLSHGDYVVNHA